MSTPNEEASLVYKMSRSMLDKLAENRWKDHWRDSDPGFLMLRLREEVDELLENPSWEEAADVANFAAMIVEVGESPALVGFNRTAGEQSLGLGPNPQPEGDER